MCQNAPDWISAHVHSGNSWPSATRDFSPKQKVQDRTLLSDPFFEEAWKVVIKLVWATPLWLIMQWLFSIVEALISGHYHSVLLSGYWIVFFTCPINWINQFSKNKITSICQPISAPLTRSWTDFTSSVWNFCRWCTVVPGKTAVFAGYEVSGFLLTLLILSFSRIQTYQSSSTFSLSTVMTLVKSSALSMQRYLIHTSEKLVELWKVLWIPKRFVAEGLRNSVV